MQETVTEVMVGVEGGVPPPLEPPPLQAEANKSGTLRRSAHNKPRSCLLNFDTISLTIRRPRRESAANFRAEVRFRASHRTEFSDVPITPFNRDFHYDLSTQDTRSAN